MPRVATCFAVVVILVASVFGLAGEGRASDVADVLRRAEAATPAFFKRDEAGDVISLHLTNGEPFTDADVAALGRLPKLRGLSVRYGYGTTKVTAECLAAIGGMRGLTALKLRCDPLDDAGIEHLAKLENLEELRIGGTRVTAVGMSRLKPLRKLRLLQVDYCSIGDVGLAELAALPGLEELDLRSTDVSDGGLDVLRRFPALKTVWLGGRVTEAAVERLRVAAPGLRVRYVP